MWVFAIGRKGLMFPEEMLCRRLAQGHTDVCGADNIWPSAVLRERAGVLVLERAGLCYYNSNMHPATLPVCLERTPPVLTMNCSALHCTVLYCKVLDCTVTSCNIFPIVQVHQISLFHTAKRAGHPYPAAAAPV